MIKNKKFGYIIIILALILLLSSCRSDRTLSTDIDLGDETGILATNNAVDFYFYYPANFVLHKNDLMIMVYVNDEDILETDRTEPSSGEYLTFMTKPNISASVFSLLEAYETIDDYWDNFAVPSLEGVFQNVSGDAAAELEVAGIPAKKYTYTMSSAGMSMKISQIIFFRNRQVYALTYTASENKYDTYVKALDTIAETFAFR